MTTSSTSLSLGAGAQAHEIRALVEWYCTAVVEGTHPRPVGKLERQCVERHLRDLERAKADDGQPGAIRFVEEWAVHAILFALRYIRHTKNQWIGKPFVLDRDTAWIAFLFWSIFGWARREPDGVFRRRFRVVYISIARKNGKTMIAAIIAAYFLLGLGEGTPEVYFFATKKDQAAIGFDQTADCIRQHRQLKRRCKIVDTKKLITVKTRLGGKCLAIGRDYKTADGFNPVLGVGDELHEHASRAGWDVVDSGMQARQEPMMVGITTAGDKAVGLWWDLDNDTVRILDGVIDDDSHFGFIARLDADDDWTDYSVFGKANPNLGVTVKEQKIRDDLRKAENNPVHLASFKRKVLNLLTESTAAWLPIHLWDACASEKPIDWSRFEGMRVWSGIDISATTDYTAMVDVFFDEDDGTFYVRPTLWIPAEKAVERQQTDRVPVAAWVEQKWVNTTAGDSIDQDVIKYRAEKLQEVYTVEELPADPHQAWKVVRELEDAGFNAFHFRQGFLSMGPAIRETEILIRRGARDLRPRLVHDGNPAMRWMIANCVIDKDPAGNKKFNKARSRDRIDGPVAMVQAIVRAVVGNTDTLQLFTLGGDDDGKGKEESA